MPTDAQPDVVVAEWRADEMRRLEVSVLLGFALAFAILAVVNAGRAHWYATFVCVVILFAELGLAGVFSVWSNRQRVELTTSEVVSRRGRREERASLDDVRAVVVGGTYRKGWATWLLLADRRSIRLPAPGLVFYNRLKVYGATGTSYWREVSDSPCGRQAALIHAAASLGDTVAPVLRSHPLRGELTRWWAPTGENSSTTAFR